MENSIPIWLLIMALFVPRITLFIAWCAGQIPANTIPFAGDVLLTIFLPRLLMLLYIHANMGLCAWFWVHLAMWILVGLNTSVRVANRRKSS